MLERMAEQRKYKTQKAGMMRKSSFLGGNVSDKLTQTEGDTALVDPLDCLNAIVLDRFLAIIRGQLIVGSCFSEPLVIPYRRTFDPLSHTSTGKQWKRVLTVFSGHRLALLQIVTV